MFFSFHKTTIYQSNEPVFKDFSWSVNANENWAIIGPMGAGKTTLLEALAGKKRIQGNINFVFLNPNESLKNKVTLAAKDYAGFRLVNQAVQYYQQRFNAQDAALAPTVWEFLTDRVRPAGTLNEKSADILPNLIDETELLEKCALLQISHLLQRKLTSLSNGETRRALMTHALLKSPTLLLLDNPFVGLDVASRKLLHEVLAKLNQNGIKIILSSTLEEIPSFITHLLVIKEGKVLWNGSKLDHKPRGEDKFIEIDNLKTFDQQFKAPFNDFVNLKNINIRYGNVQVLKNVSWQIKKGEKWALLGPNGSGKSSLLSIIMADNPQSYANDFEIFDQNRNAGMSIWDIKKNIGFVSPELHLYADKQVSVFKTIASGLFDAAGLFQKLNEEQIIKINNAIELLNLKHISDRILQNCSSGEQRMVFLARALVKNPAVLILDEPCQGLDEPTILIFKEIIDALCQNPERTLIYVTHYQNEIPKSVTKTLKLAMGEVVDEYNFY